MVLPKRIRRAETGWAKAILKSARPTVAPARQTVTIRKKKMESIKKEGDGEDKEVKRKIKRDLERVRKKET